MVGFVCAVYYLKLTIYLYFWGPIVCITTSHHWWNAFRSFYTIKESTTKLLKVIRGGCINAICVVDISNISFLPRNDSHACLTFTIVNKMISLLVKYCGKRGGQKLKKSEMGTYMEEDIWKAGLYTTTGYRNVST